MPDAGREALPTSWADDWFVVFMPDLSDEAAAQVSAAGAWGAFVAFFRLLRQRQREAERDAKSLSRRAAAAAAGPDRDEAASRAAAMGRRAAECLSGILDDEGIRGMARSVGIEVKAMRRQVGELERIGILVVARPPAWSDRDPESGRIIRRPVHRGIVPAARIVFNAGDEHRRPANRQGANRPLRPVSQRGRQGAIRPLPPGARKGRSAPTPISQKHISPPGAAAAALDGRTSSTAGMEAGRHPPARAGQEGVGRSDLDRQGHPHPDATPAPPAETGGRAGTQEPTGDRPAPVGLVPPPDPSCRQTRPAAQFLDPGGRGGAAPETSPADGSGMDPARGSWLAEYRRLRGLTAAEPPDPDEAAQGLREALRELPDESRDRARDLGEHLDELAGQEAAMVTGIIQSKLTEDSRARAAGRHRQREAARQRHRDRRPAAAAG